MAARSQVALALLLLHAVATLAQFTWKGGDMLFSNGDNWLNRRGPTQVADPTVTPCSTFFGSPNPNVNVISQLTTQVYYVGTNLFLPQNGVLRLALDGTTIAFSTSQDTCNPALPSYNWTGGLTPERRNDFYCHSNWLFNGAEIVLPPTPDLNTLGSYVPCAGDSAVFETDKSYKVFVPNNVTLVVLSSLVVDGITYSTLASTAAVESQVDLFDTTATVAFGPSQSSVSAVCTRNFAWYQNRFCQCFSTCFPPNFQAAVVAQLKGQQSTAAQRQAQIDAAVALRRFSGTFLPSSLGLTSSQVADNLNNETQTAALIVGVTAALYGVPAFNVSDVTLTLSSNGNAVITGNINTTNAALYLAGSLAIAPNPVTWTAVGPPGNVTQLQYIAQSTLATLMAQYIAIQLQAELNQQVNGLDPNSKDVINTLVTLPNSAALLDAANNDPCFSTCVSNCSDCVADLSSLFQTTFGLNATLAEQLATSITNAKNTNPQQWADTSNTINSAVNSTQTLNNVNNAKNQNTPQTYSGSIRILIGNGAGSSQYLQYQVMSPANLYNFTQRVVKYLQSFSKLQSVQNIQVFFVPDVNARRRRRGLNSAIGVSFNYNVSCVSVDTVCQTLGTTKNDIAAGLNNAFDQFTPAANACYESNDPTTQFKCLVGYADTYCRNVGASSAIAYITNLTICGSSPPIPGGGCVDYNPTAEFTSKNVVGNSTVCSPVAAASSSGGGGGLAFAGAGAGAAIVIIAIIVIIVMRRKKAKSTGGTSKRADDRTVVAFENPMYDDHTQQNNQPVYDGGMHNDSEGLYDEPAFSASNKVNPVYQSNEDLTAGEGYLETGKAGGDGYLDVNPNVPTAEDVGYLGSEEQPSYDNNQVEEPAYQDHKGLDPGYQDSNRGFGFEDSTYAAAE